MRRYNLHKVVINVMESGEPSVLNHVRCFLPCGARYRTEILSFQMRR